MTRTKVAYTLLVVLNAGLAALAAGLAKGTVPLPESALWAAPILVAMLTALTAQLPRWDEPPEDEP